MTKARTPRHVWEKRIERPPESELTDAEFANELGVNVHTLRSWKWKLRDEKLTKGAARTRRSRGRARRTAPSPTFIEVAAPAGGGIELVVCDVEVRVPVVCEQPQDMRRSFDGLSAAAREHLGEDPQSGALFVFINKRRNRITLERA